MLTIDDYCDLAKKHQDFKSDRELAKALSVSQATVSDWRTKRKWPRENLMFRLSTLAGLDPKIGLIHLAAWKTDGQAHDAFVSIAKGLSDQNIKQFA